MSLRKELTDEEKKIIHIKTVIEASIDHLVELPEPLDDKVLQQLTTEERGVKLQNQINEFKLAVAKLKQVFEIESKGTVLEEPFHTLRQCITQPTQFFNRLEIKKPEIYTGRKLTKPAECYSITIGEVQTHILNFITQKILNAAAKSKIQKDTLDWNQENLLTSIVTDSFNKQFVSGLKVPSNYDPVHAQQPALTRPFEINFTHEDDQVTYSVKITLPNREDEIPMENPVDQIHLDDEDPDDEPDFDELLPVAQLCAVPIVSDYILTYLKDEKVIEAQECKCISAGARRLITYSAYLDLLRTKKISFSEIKDIKETEVDSLLMPVAIELVTSQKCPLYIVKKIDSEILANPFFNHKIYSGELEEKQILALCNLTPFERKNLLSPNIQHLIELKKLSIDQAKKMSANCRSFLENENYFKLFKKGEIDFRAIQDLPDKYCQALLNIDEQNIQGFKTVLQIKNPLILYFVNIKILKIDEVAKISGSNDSFPVADTEFHKYYNKKHVRKMIEEFLKLAEAGLLFERDLFILNSNLREVTFGQLHHESKGEAPSFNLLKIAAIQRACVNNIFWRLEAIHQENPFSLQNGETDSLDQVILVMEKFKIHFDDIWFHIFSLRLLGVFQNYPYPVNNVVDNVPRILQAMDDVFQQKQISNQQNPLFFYKVMKNLFNGILNDLSSEINHTDSKLNPFYEKMCSEYSVAEQYEQESKFTGSDFDLSCWHRAFNNIAQYAKTTLESLPTTSFAQDGSEPPAKRLKTNLFGENNRLKEFCLSMGQLAQGLNEYKPKSPMEVAQSQSSNNSSNNSSNAIAMRGPS